MGSADSYWLNNPDSSESLGETESKPIFPEIYASLLDSRTKGLAINENTFSNGPGSQSERTLDLADAVCQSDLGVNLEKSHKQDYSGNIRHLDFSNLFALLDEEVSSLDSDKKLPPVDQKKEETDFKKMVSDLIEKLGDEDFDKREMAQENLVKLGSAAYDPLEKAKQNTDLEIVWRAKEAQETILKNDPFLRKEINAMYAEAMAEVAKGGKLSPAIREKYQNLIEIPDGLKMSDAEFILRSDALA